MLEEQKDQIAHLYVNGAIIEQQGAKIPLDADNSTACFKSVGDLYEKCRDKDLFLYVNYKTLEYNNHKLQRWDIIATFGVILLALFIDLYWYRNK